MPKHGKIAFSLALLLLGSRADAGSRTDTGQTSFDTSATVRQEFVAAMDRVRLRLPDSEDSPALQAYGIYGYLRAARLRRDLAQSADETLDSKIDQFLQVHAGQPSTRLLRHDWLVSLAQRQRWDWFLPRSVDAADAQLVCQRLDARLGAPDHEHDETLAADALARWALPQKPPLPCVPVFLWLRAQGLITAQLAETRARAALAADNPRLAREFAADVPAPRAIELLRWSDLLEAPKSALNVLATHPALPIDPDALAAGFDKLTRLDMQAALLLLQPLLARGDTTAALRAHLQRAAALAAAYARDPRALEVFTQLPAEALDNQVQEWRVRAALWAADFRQALIWIEQMPPELAAMPRWRYWHARAIAATAGEAAGEAAFADLSQLRDYYGYLAADQLHRSYQLNAHASPQDAAIQGALATEEGLVRARELFDCGMGDEAAAEWSVSMTGAGNAIKVQAAQLAASWGWYSQSIITLAQTGEFDDVALRYPRPYAQEVVQGANLAQLSPDWIYAVMRQESLFRKDAVSRADARGLMQMLPGTATAVARRWHLRAPNRETLFDPAVAVPLGAAYLRELLNRYGGDLPVTLAAYNAGPAAVERWVPLRTMDADIWIENIPYNETRAYVQHIVEHIVAFAYVNGAQPPRLQSLLPQQRPPGTPLEPVAAN